MSEEALDTSQHPEDAAEQQHTGVVRWEPLNDTKAIPEETPPTRQRPKSMSPHQRNLSTSIYGFDQDAYDSVQNTASSNARPSFSRTASMEAPMEESPLNASVLGGGTSHSTKSKSKKSKDAPIIPAAQLSEEDSGDRIRLGICAMDKKARSKPMAEILSRLDEKDFQVVFFGDDMILNRDVEEWPICDVVVAFFSKGYPLPKAKEYVTLRKPFILNDLEMQEVSDSDVS